MAAPEHPRTSLFGTEERTLFSPIRNREYHLSVSLPESYATADERFPVIYVLDGDLLFGMAVALTPLAQWFSGIPESIVVGVGYDMESHDEWIHLRERDFKVPAVPDAPADSAADLFLESLVGEMLPFIDAEYRTDPGERTLYGYSSSGFFSLYALFHRPDAFRRYLSGSGDLYEAHPYLVQHDEQLAAVDGAAPIELYLSAGDREVDQFPHFDRLVGLFGEEAYPGLTLHTEIYRGEDHGAEGTALTYLHGLRAMYPQAGR